MKSIILLMLLSIFTIQPGTKYQSPPQTKKLQDDFFGSITELRNVDYCEFLYAIDDTLEKKNNYPDVNIWLKTYPSEYNSKLAFKDPKYSYYPVVGITYEQAVSYCKWLSIIVTKKYGQGKFIYTYRLPEKSEWILMAKNSGSINVDKKLSPYKAKLKSKRFLHVFDNVSEMINEPNMAMGSNWMFQNKDFTKPIEYGNPQPWLGFRFVCEVKTIEDNLK